MTTSLLRSCAAGFAALFAATLSAQLPNCFETSLGTPLPLTLFNDPAVPVALGFTFPGPTGPVTSVNVSMNGFVWLSPYTASGDGQHEESWFLSEPARIACGWVDGMYFPLPPIQGAVYHQTFPASGGTPARAVFSWWGVRYFGSIDYAYMQLELRSDGEVLIGHDVANFATRDPDFVRMIVGISAGNGAAPNEVSWRTTLEAGPLNTGNNPTVYDLMGASIHNLNQYDFAGRSYRFVPNGTGGYVVSERLLCRQAQVVPYGSGCPKPAQFYEAFSTGVNAVDLANSAIDLVPGPFGSFIAVPGSNTFLPHANNLNLGDEDVAFAQALPFAFPHPGGSTNLVDVSANGFLYLSTDPQHGTLCCDGDPSTLRSITGLLAAFWQDLDPSLAGPGGGVFFDSDPVAGRAWATWVDVPEYGSTGQTNTFQLVLYSSGTIELRWAGLQASQHQVLVGYNAGATEVDVGQTDLSAMPWSTMPSGVPVTLLPVGGSRPRFGTSFAFETSQVPVGAPLGLLLGAYQTDSIDLASIGAPDCYLLVGPIGNVVSGGFTVSGASVPHSIAVPATTALAGAEVMFQSALLQPSANAFGFVFSNGLRAILGL